MKTKNSQLVIDLPEPNEDKYEKFDEMVRKESEGPEGELYCPVCGSHRLYYYLGFRIGQIYVCKDCGYQGPLIIEDGKLADKIREKWFEGSGDSDT